MKARCVRSRRGVVLLMAVGMLAVMGLLMVLITVRMTSDVKRSTRQATATQSRHLLLAGATFARWQLQHDATADVAVPLPDELAGDTSLTLGNWSRRDSSATVTIRVIHLDRTEQQTAEFERTDAGWQLLSLQPETR